MNGAESMLETLANNGVEVCFSNPGTSEMHMVAAMGKSTRMRSILGLFEAAMQAQGPRLIEVMLD